MTRAILLLLAAALAANAPAHPAVSSADGTTIRFNDNRAPAGTLRDGALTLRLDAVTGAWRPEAEAGPVRTVHAFAEEGRAPTIPGPLVRVPEGTEIRISVRNRIAGSTLQIGRAHV